MSVSPAQKRSKPAPVPAPLTVTWTPGCSSPKNSDAASANGCTVEEPSIVTLPLSSSVDAPSPATADAEAPESSSSPHAASPAPIAPQSAIGDHQAMCLHLRVLLIGFNLRSTRHTRARCVATCHGPVTAS